MLFSYAAAGVDVDLYGVPAVVAELLEVERLVLLLLLLLLLLRLAPRGTRVSAPLYGHGVGVDRDLHGGGPARAQALVLVVEALEL